MGIFSYFRKGKGRSKPSRQSARLNVERLEDRTLPSGNTISGYVYQDANHNGLFDPGESPIANTAIELRNAQNVVVGTTTTDAKGYYQFQNDNTIQSTPLTITKTLSFPNTPTNFSLQGLVDQFDPSLGELQSVKITQNGAITSKIGVENTSTSSGSKVVATVSGNITLTGPAGLSVAVDLQDNVGNFQAGTFDSNIDFAGSSGHSFDPDTVSGTKTVTLTGGDMTAFIGAGQVSLTEVGNAASQASGGGNVVVSLVASGKADVTVTYTYIPRNSLKPGDYTIYETQPQGFFDGQESSGGIVLDHAPGTDFIKVTLAGADVPNNNFGELKPASLAGYVYVDVNNNGVKDGPEAGIAGVTVTLTGTDDQGAVSKTAITDATGAYQFLSLRPGSYTLAETQPAGYLDGKDAIGSQGGTTGNDQLTNINLQAGTDGVNNNFGELKSTGLSGFVYADSNNNGVKDPGENGIANTTITLSGTDDQGAVSKTATTDAAGAYQFADLRPGSYALSETQPAGYMDGKDTIGSQGGTAGNDQLTGINLQAGMLGINNNFGELQSTGLSGFVYVDANDDGIKEPGETPLANVTVTLSGADDLGPVSKTATTDANGQYQFLDLRPGTYTLTETQPADYADGKDTVGSAGGSTSNDKFSTIVLPSGTVGNNYNFGERPLSSLAGHVFADINNNGIKDGPEQGMAGVTVTLTGTSDLGSVSLTTTTDPTGAYQFLKLRPGTYTISETQPANYLDGKDTIGSQGGNAGNDVFSAINLPAATQGVNNDFGELLPAGISGYVYADANNNGVKDPGEAPIANTTVTLTGSNDVGSVSLTATTDGSGQYKFTQLRPGTYAVTETQPAGYNDGQDTVGSAGGTVSNDQISAIALAAGLLATDYNFGEVVPEKADLGIVKTANPTSVLVGGNFTYTLTVTNHGDFTAKNVKVTDNLPPNVTLLTATGPGWTFALPSTATGGTFTATLPSLAVGASSVITVTVKAPIVAGLLTNATDVTSTTPDNNPDNNHSEVTTLVYNQPGKTFPQGVTPLATQFGVPTTGKWMLFSDSAGIPTTASKANLAFVDGLYRSLLGRAADYKSQVAYAQKLDSGALSREQLVADFWSSDTHRALQASELYQIFYDRTPSASEVQAVVAQFHSGKNEMDIALSFLTSPEYQASHPSAGGLLAGFYADVMGAVPDLSSQLVFLQDVGSMSTDTLAQTMLYKTESIQRIVDNGFLAILRRHATPNELQSWTSQIQGGQSTLGGMMQTLLASNEFLNLALNSATTYTV